MPLKTPVKVACFYKACLFGVALSVVGTTARPAIATPEAEALADKLMEYRVPGGGILVDSPASARKRIVPYFGNFAALGWTETAAVTTDTAKRARYLQAAREWMDWYAANQNPDGTIYDHEGKNGILERTTHYDSTDSYPATYAMLMWSYHRASGDTAYVQGKARSLASAYDAMLLTVDNEGLTYAKPGFYYRYLMDNCEVGAGLAAFARLFDLLGRTAQASEAHVALGRLKKALPQMYRSSHSTTELRETFGIALDPYGKITGNFSRGYPDAMANLFALTFLAEGTGEEDALLHRVKTAFWDKPDAYDFPQWWLWAAIASKDADLEQKAWASLREQVALPDAHSHLIGMAAATMCSGLESVRFPEVLMPWNKLTAAAPPRPVAPNTPQLAGDGVGLYLTFRGSTSTITNHGWRALSLDLPARIDYEITTTTGYLLAHVVPAQPWDLRGSDAIKLTFTVPADSALQAQATLVETDGDLWVATMPSTTAGENIATLDFSKLKTNKKGNHTFEPGSVRGIRLQFDNKGRQLVSGHVELNEILLVERDEENQKP